MSFDTVIFLDLAEYHRLKDCEKQMHALLLEKKKNASVLVAPAAPRPSSPKLSLGALEEKNPASELEGGGIADLNLPNPLPADVNVDVSPPPQIPIMYSSFTEKINPSLLHQTVAAERRGIIAPSNPGYQLKTEDVLPSSSKAAGFELPKHSVKQTAVTSLGESSQGHPWYYLGGYYSDSDSE